MVARAKAKGLEGKTESITMRLSPKLKFGLELLARQRQQPVSVIATELFEAAIREQLTWQSPISVQPGGRPISLLDHVWDPLEPDRLLKLAEAAPQLLSDDERLLQKVIQESPQYRAEGGAPAPAVVREHWKEISDAAARLKRTCST